MIVLITVILFPLPGGSTPGSRTGSKPPSRAGSHASLDSGGIPQWRFFLAILLRISLCSPSFMLLAIEWIGLIMFFFVRMCRWSKRKWESYSKAVNQFETRGLRKLQHDAYVFPLITTSSIFSQYEREWSSWRFQWKVSKKDHHHMRNKIEDWTYSSVLEIVNGYLMSPQIHFELLVWCSWLDYEFFSCRWNGINCTDTDHSSY